MSGDHNMYQAKQTPIKKGAEKLQAELNQARKDIESLPPIELMVRNSQLTEFVSHWTDRAVSAEQMVEQLKAVGNAHIQNYNTLVDRICAIADKDHIDDAIKYLDGVKQYTTYGTAATMLKKIAELEAAIDKLTAGEPVAWMYEWNGKTNITTTDQRPIEKAHQHFNKSDPLYTASQVAAAVAQASKRGAPCERHCEANAFRIELRQKDKRIAELESQLAAARKPLTDEEIWKFWWNKPEVAEGEDDSMEAQFVAAARAIEAAHGIKEQP